MDAIQTSDRAPEARLRQGLAASQPISVFDHHQLRVGAPIRRTSHMTVVVPLAGVIHLVDREDRVARRVCFGRMLLGHLGGLRLRAGDHTEARCVAMSLGEWPRPQSAFFGPLDHRIYGLALQASDDVSPLHEAMTARCAALLGARARSCRRLPGAGSSSRALYDRLLQAKDRAESVAACRVQDLARLSSSSISHFPRLFRAAFGCAPKAHIDACRIRLAKALLVWSDANLTEIGMTCGFLDRTAFARAFARIAATPPSTFRKRFTEAHVAVEDLVHFQ